MRRLDPPAVDDARLARQWAGIRRRLERKRTVARVGRAVAAAGVLVALVFFGARTLRRLDAPNVATSSTVAGAMELADGSRVELGPGAHAHVDATTLEEVRVTLDDGKITIAATHEPRRRSFTVLAGTHSVEVVGTRFSVERSGDDVVVAVTEGRVRVLRAGSPLRTVSAGERFASAEQDERDAGAAAETSAETSEAPSPQLDEATGAATPSAASARPTPERTTDRLFEEAQRARAEGRLAAAAQGFDLLRRERRSDPRASLAAFELGRLRLEALGDPHGAVEAFSDALMLGPKGALAEDAEARRVQALGRTGDRARCTAARDEYVAKHPYGVYVDAVAVYCR